MIHFHEFAATESVDELGTYVAVRKRIEDVEERPTELFPAPVRPMTLDACEND
jgi:hypothetical protein